VCFKHGLLTIDMLAVGAVGLVITTAVFQQHTLQHTDPVCMYAYFLPRQTLVPVWVYFTSSYCILLWDGNDVIGS